MVDVRHTNLGSRRQGRQTTYGNEDPEKPLNEQVKVVEKSEKLSHADSYRAEDLNR